MKTPPARINRLRPTPLAAALLIPLFSSVAPATQTDPAPKNHILFVGTDLAVKEGDRFFHVVGATEDALKIDKDHRIEEVRIGEDANVRVSRGVKLSNLSATISDVRMESVDPAVARAELAAMQSYMILQQEAGDQEDRLHGRMVLMSAVAINTDTGVRGADISRANLDAEQARLAAAYTAALPALSQLANSTSTLLDQSLAHSSLIDDEVTIDASALPGLKLADGSDVGGPAPGGAEPSGSAAGNPLTRSFVEHNTPSSTAQVELTFEVSSPTPLDHPYIVVVANYAPLSNPNRVRRQITTREFAHIDSQPQRVKMRRAASIDGMPFKKFDIALYANGQEVATNLSDKRLPLTDDEAYQFFLIDYLSNHKDATLPPAPMLMTSRTEFRSRLGNADANQAIYATVDKSGNILTLSTDAAGKHKVPVPVEAILQDVRFVPALKKGSPVDGQAKVTLAQLAN